MKIEMIRAYGILTMEQVIIYVVTRRELWSLKRRFLNQRLRFLGFELPTIWTRTYYKQLLEFHCRIVNFYKLDCRELFQGDEVVCEAVVKPTLDLEKVLCVLEELDVAFVEGLEGLLTVCAGGRTGEDGGDALGERAGTEEGGEGLCAQHGGRRRGRGGRGGGRGG